MTTTPTTRETAAAHRLAEALVEFLVAAGEGHAARCEVRDREAARVQKSHLPPVATKETTTRQPLLLSTREAAKCLGMSDRMLGLLTAPNGPIPCVRLTRRVQYRLSDLEEAVEQMRVKPRKETGR